jgi:hypothetical protein
MESTTIFIGHGRHNPVATTTSDNANPKVASRRCAQISGAACRQAARKELVGFGFSIVL